MYVFKSSERKLSLMIHVYINHIGVREKEIPWYLFGEKVVQDLWAWPTNVWFILRSKPLERAHTPHSLDGQQWDWILRDLWQVVIREASSSSSWVWVPIPTVRHCMKRESKLKVSIGSKPSEIQNPAEGHKERLERVRGNGRHQDNAAQNQLSRAHTGS